MTKKDFDNLVTSVRQAGRIRRGEVAASRVIEFTRVDVKAIRLKLKRTQSDG
jgi:putative transcriptional regulator